MIENFSLEGAKLIQVIFGNREGVIHGEVDGVIPTEHGRELHAASPANPKQFIGVPRAGHNNLYQLAGDEVIRSIEEFVGQTRSE